MFVDCLFRGCRYGEQWSGLNARAREFGLLCEQDAARDTLGEGGELVHEGDGMIGGGDSSLDLIGL
jgi:hypothetical protein